MWKMYFLKQFWSFVLFSFFIWFYVFALVVIALLKLNLTDLRSAQSTSDRFELLLSDFQPAEVGQAAK